MTILVNFSQRDLDNVIISIQILTDDYQDSIAEEAYKLMRDTTPVRTGRARRGWEKRRSRFTGSTRVVENKVPYVIYLNEGHSRQAPKGYIQQALESGILAANRKFETEKRFK